jgi:hypothetical protein
MRGLGLAMTVLTPILLAACGDDSEKAPATAVVPPAQVRPASTAPDTAGSVALRLTPEGLLATPATAPPAAPSRPTPAPSAQAASAPQEPSEDTPPTEAEVRGLYEGIMYTYAFDACGLPLVGQTARKDIEERIEVCPNPPLRKDAFRTVYHRAVEVAEEDPEKMRASASRACPDKREFLRRVMSHAGELQFDPSQPLECGLLSPARPDASPANPAASAQEPTRGGRPF